MSSYGRITRFIRSRSYAARPQASESSSERYQGLRLLTDTGRHVAVMIEEGHYCCENAGYCLSTASLDEWMGKELLEVKWVSGSPGPTFPPLPVSGKDDDIRKLFTAIVELRFVGDTPPLRIILYNDRNPCAYSHQIFRALDGSYDWQDL